MAFKNPVKVKNLPKLKGSQFLKMLAVILNKKFLDGNSVPFIIVLNHIYAGFDEKKSKRHPLFLVGDRHSCWKDYHKQKTPDGASQKEFMVSGSCRRNGNEFVLDINGSKGLKKVPRETMKFLNALLKKISKQYSVTTIGSTAGVIDEELQKAKAQDVLDETKDSKDQLTRELKHTEENTAYKEQRREEANKLSKSIKSLTKLLSTSLKKVTKNIKKGATSNNDIKNVKEANKAFSDFMSLYDETSEEVRKKFNSAHKKLTAQKEQLIKLSLAAKKTKKSIAQRLADNYSQNKTGKPATESTIKEINNIIKKVFAENKKTKQDDLLRMIAFVLGKVGINQELIIKYVNQIVEKQGAK
ncbi:MAG: hypothetical protein MK207_03475 [Saprospiraceae bacterium]|nr:hypothetical protein [Saprospiraceae bacterium]